MRQITFSMPLPPQGCKPGSRGHWARKARAVREHREAGKIACLCAMGRERPQFAKAEIDYDFYLCRKPGDSYHPRDDDNARAAMKGAQDGFVDAGIVSGDSARVLKVSGVNLRQKKKDHQGRAEVVVTIREID